MILAGVRQFAAMLRAKSANLDIVHTTFANPKIIRDALRAGFTTLFAEWIRKVPASAWAAYPAANAQNLERVKRFVAIAPNGAAVIADYVKTLESTGGTDPIDAIPGAPDGTLQLHAIPHATTFLRNSAKWTSHTFFSPKLSDADREAIISLLAGEGYNAIYLYAANEGDYGGKAVLYTAEARATWRAWLQRCHAAGLRPILWMRADDSSGLNKWTDAQWIEFFTSVVAGLDDLIAGYVLGLEVNEYWSESRARGLTSALKALTKRSVGVHTSSLEHIGHAKGADLFYLQIGFGKDGSEMKRQVREAIQRFGGPVVAAEYHMSGETAAARDLGNDAIDGGAVAVGNGCTPDYIRKLANTVDVGGVRPVTPVVPVPPAASGARLVKFEKAKKDYFVDFAFEGVGDWPEKPDGKGGKICGWIVLKGVKVEQFRKTMKTQSLGNAKGKDEHGVTIAQGETIPVILESYDGKQTNTVPFVWPWKSTR